MNKKERKKLKKKLIAEAYLIYPVEPGFDVFGSGEAPERWGAARSLYIDGIKATLKQIKNDKRN